MTISLSEITSRSVYDPKAKKSVDSIEVGGVNFHIGDRVCYTGLAFEGRLGSLVKIRVNWLSSREASRAGFSGQGGKYVVTALVLWDDYGLPQSCGINELKQVNEIAHN